MIAGRGRGRRRHYMRTVVRYTDEESKAASDQCTPVRTGLTFLASFRISVTPKITPRRSRMRGSNGSRGGLRREGANRVIRPRVAARPFFDHPIGRAVLRAVAL